MPATAEPTIEELVTVYINSVLEKHFTKSDRGPLVMKIGGLPVEVRFFVFRYWDTRVNKKMRMRLTNQNGTRLTLRVDRSDDMMTLTFTSIPAKDDERGTSAA